MEIFKYKNGVVTSEEIISTLGTLNLKSKTVIVYSRLLSVGQFLGESAIKEFLEILKNLVGPDGNVIIPTYTLGTYKEPRVYNHQTSKIISGSLGIVASKDPTFKRTIHPIYSHCVWGKDTEYFLEQDATTNNGENSFFDLFSKKENSYVLMIGINLNGPTLIHHYDQKFNAKGRYLKYFKTKMIIGDNQFDMSFSAYVKDTLFYENKKVCLHFFHSLLSKLNLVSELKFGNDYIFGVEERVFKEYYHRALKVDQQYFLISNHEIWNEYYWRNNHFYLRDTIDDEKIRRIIEFK